MNCVVAILLLAVVGLANCADGNLWAVLVAGSNTWDNYRHQADVYHAYQILHKHGIPDERIIVMHYDDIASDPENPLPGKVINQPNGNDVYHGVPKDYTGDTVTPDTFLKVIQGIPTNVGSGKVLQSGPNDHVFINFVDHGGPGIIAFPNDDVVTVKQLNDAILAMHSKQMYNKLVFYVEACESGSMFEGVLPANINVFATTAANSQESSWGCYCDVPGWTTCLGDTYSVNWMQDSDKEDIETETLQTQYTIVKQETNESHVMEYGDQTISQLTVGQFQGRQGRRPLIGLPRMQFPKVPSGKNSRVPTHDIPIHNLKRKLQRTNSIIEKQKLQNELNITLAKRSLVEAIVTRIAQVASLDFVQTRRVLTQRVNRIGDLNCHHNVVKAFSRNCFNLAKNQYALKHMFVINNLCEEKIDQGRILHAIQSVCHEELVNKGIH